jgi:putative phosphoribosyl transferase
MKMPGLPSRSQDLEIPSQAGPLKAARHVPDGAAGLVVLVHADGGKVRNGRLERALGDAGLGTLRLPLANDGDGPGPGDIAPLAQRVLEALDWVGAQPDLGSLPVGLFAPGRGAGVALIAAAERSGRVAAVVASGGRPDLAGDALERVQAPTLLIVGGEDQAVLEFNRTAMHQVRSECELQIVPGAGRRFDEPGAEDTLVELTRGWFQRYLARALGPEPPRKPREGGGT